MRIGYTRVSRGSRAGPRERSLLSLGREGQGKKGKEGKGRRKRGWVEGAGQGERGRQSGLPPLAELLSSAIRIDVREGERGGGRGGAGGAKSKSRGKTPSITRF